MERFAQNSRLCQDSQIVKTGDIFVSDLLNLQGNDKSA